MKQNIKVISNYIHIKMICDQTNMKTYLRPMTIADTVSNFFFKY